MSRLNYSNALYLGMVDYLFSRLQLIQNEAAKVICNKLKRTSESTCFNHLHWLPVRKRARFKVLCYTHKSLHQSGPAILCGKVAFYKPSRALRSSHRALIRSTRIRKTRMGGRSFGHLAALHLKVLPLEMRLIEDLLVFYKRLKTWLYCL